MHFGVLNEIFFGGLGRLSQSGTRSLPSFEWTIIDLGSCGSSTPAKSMLHPLQTDSDRILEGMMEALPLLWTLFPLSHLAVLRHHVFCTSITSPQISMIPLRTQ
jgi:hypothetical protein